MQLTDSILAVAQALARADALAGLDAADPEQHELQAAVLAVSRSVPCESQVGRAHEDLEAVRSILEVSHRVVVDADQPDIDEADCADAWLPMIGRQFDENLHSDFLASLLSSRRVGGLAAELFARLFAHGHRDRLAPAPTTLGHVISERELRLDQVDARLAGSERGARRIDILARAGQYVLVVENKVWTSESSNQTRDYATAVEAAYPSMTVCCLLLSPGGLAGVDKAFRGLAYHELYSLLVDLGRAEDWGQRGHALLSVYSREIASAFLVRETRARRHTRRLLRERNYDV